MKFMKQAFHKFHKFHTNYNFTTMSVRFCLSKDPIQWDFIAFKMIIISKRKRIVDRDVVNDVTGTCQSTITLVVI